jgi:hypothetical protein
VVDTECDESKNEEEDYNYYRYDVVLLNHFEGSKGGEECVRCGLALLYRRCEDFCVVDETKMI